MSFRLLDLLGYLGRRPSSSTELDSIVQFFLAFLCRDLEENFTSQVEI